MGGPIEENKFLFSLNYADDQVIITQDAEDLDVYVKFLVCVDGYKFCFVKINC